MTKTEEMHIQGKKVIATDLDFQTLAEDWNVYKLEDGTKLKIKTVASKIIRVEGEYNNEGDPIYHVKSMNIVTTDIPPELKRKTTRKDVN